MTTRDTGWSSLFRSVARDCKGRIKHRGKLRANTRTTGADWRSCRNWQTAMMAGAAATANDAETGTATSTAATTLTNTGAAFPTANNGYNGHIVVAGNVYGVILSNTATVLTVDRWNNPGSPGGAAGATPAGTAVYVIMPGNAPAWWLALSTSAVAPTAADTTLASEITTGGLARAVWTTLTFTSGGSSYTMQNVFTASATFTVNSEAVFNAQNGGAMPFASPEPSPPTLVSGDTLTQQVTVSIG